MPHVISIVILETDLNFFNLYSHLTIIFLSNLSETPLSTQQVLPENTLGKGLEFIDIKYCENH